jgi:hypothetical protein
MWIIANRLYRYNGPSTPACADFTDVGAWYQPMFSGSGVTYQVVANPT